MGRNNADFSAGLFHGSDHVFKEGDILDPLYAGDQDPGVFATDVPEVARSYGKHVYTVEPVDPKEKLERDAVAMRGREGSGSSFRSDKGFRVTGKVRVPKEKAVTRHLGFSATMETEWHGGSDHPMKCSICAKNGVPQKSDGVK